MGCVTYSVDGDGHVSLIGDSIAAKSLNYAHQDPIDQYTVGPVRFRRGRSINQFIITEHGAVTIRLQATYHILLLRYIPIYTYTTLRFIITLVPLELAGPDGLFIYYVSQLIKCLAHGKAKSEFAPTNSSVGCQATNTGTYYRVLDTKWTHFMFDVIRLCAITNIRARQHSSHYNKLLMHVLVNFNHYCYTASSAILLIGRQFKMRVVLKWYKLSCFFIL